MSIVTEKWLSHEFEYSSIVRGRAYFKSGRVITYNEEWLPNGLSIQSIVKGTKLYKVNIHFDDLNDLDSGFYHCSCPQCEEWFECKHIVAVLYHHMSLQQAQKGIDFAPKAKPKTSKEAKKLLERYKERAFTEGDAPEQPVRLVPILHPSSYQGPYLSFKVGNSRLYVLKNLVEFSNCVAEGYIHSYGKKLSFRHTLDAFDEPSRRVVRFIQAMVYSRIAANDGYISGYYRDWPSDAVLLSKDVLELHFEEIQAICPQSEKGELCVVEDFDPPVHLKFSSVDGMICLQRTTGADAYAQVNGWRHTFLIGEGRISRASLGYSAAMKDLLEAYQERMTFLPEDLSAFCSVVLPEIKPYVQIEDPQGLLEQYMPEECVPQFYFDLSNQQQLNCALRFRYGERVLPYPCEDAQGIRRDVRAEDAALRLLEHNFIWQQRYKRFVWDEAGDLYDYLIDGLDRCRMLGEAYLSDRLRAKEIHASTAAVGISVSGGVLTLALDTGGFPCEELEALYQSLLQRRKYHLLQDGRFMRIEGDGAGLEAIAETAHMIQLSPEQLREGSVRMPAFRALYLDAMLDKKDGVRVQRDQQFRDMVRRFKTVEDSDYAMPEGILGELRPYQETGYRWLRTLESCGFGGILADEMGLGKTLQTIAFFASKPRRETGLPHLVVCPASLVLNWQDELARFAPALKASLIAGNLHERREQLAREDDSDVWITSYDLLKRDIDLYAEKRFYACVLDEGQFVKNQSTKASKAVKAINCAQRFVLTGTPIENRLSELWNLFDFLMPGYLYSHQRFMERLEKPIIRKDDAQARQQLARLVRPFMLRRLKKDVLRELPDKMEYVRRIPLTEEERKVYHAQAMQVRSELAGSQERMQILAALTRLRQICCDPNLVFENYAGETSKLEACMELVASMTENGHQILLFSQFTSMLDVIRERLNAAGISSYTLQGSTPREERARLVRQFNEGGAQVFLISLKAGGTGLNLTAADVVIHYDPWWNIAAQNQATDRAHRIGQVHSVQVYKLIAEGTVEERILELQQRKEQLLDAVAAESGEGILSMKPEELLALIEE